MTMEAEYAAQASTPMSAASPTWQANLARLEGLAEVLAHHGLRARLMTPRGGVPSLHVVNPLAAALAEDVYAGRGQDGLWWFWWSWAERIAAGEDLEGAAAMIRRVLAAT
jgi:hypothetical protein